MAGVLLETNGSQVQILLWSWPSESVFGNINHYRYDCIILNVHAKMGEVNYLQCQTRS